ncbi:MULTISPECIES: RNA polymerase sigma factor [Anaerotruncus]|jgi:DNA-directed RNA polymerase specialized sigma24 family protein|uniref:RNA polymerase sigma factor n=1 Tax=Anaerotruncus TaxID=244127 RepID=UPI00082C7584|nr:MULTISPECIES: sigma-70 family RNA polymerase sigma factor [Anaerotruncus]RGX55384.1 hypothetical protein DWV16_09175 [Anaerotruncus sp. AF02-27]
MEKAGLADTQYQALYERMVPGLYKSALYLLGSQEAAEQAVVQAFAKSCSEESGQEDASLPLKFSKNLVDACSKIEKDTHYISEKVISSGNAKVVQSLAALTFGDRKLIVLALVQGCSVPEIAKIVGLPGWIVERRLRRVTGDMMRPFRQSVTCGREPA